LLNTREHIKTSLLWAGGISLVVYLFVLFLGPKNQIKWIPEMHKASQWMDQSIEVIQTFCQENNITMDPIIDPNQTGLIGPELSPLTTSLGHLEAKRTSANPDMAALVVHFLNQAGIVSGDTIGIGASASFPGLLVASLSACRAMELHPIVIISMGTSSYGATRPHFHFLDLYTLLMSHGIIINPPAGLSFGGDKDLGLEFDQELKNRLLRDVQKTKIPFIHEDDLSQNVQKRLELYFGTQQNRKLKAFINIGGAYANMGTSPQILTIKPGLTIKAKDIPETERGILFEMLSREIPVVHLLYVKGLISQYGLPWDPLPLPKPGTSKLVDPKQSKPFLFYLISCLYFISILLLIFRKNTTSIKGKDLKTILFKNNH